MKRILQSEKERKDLAGIKKLARERAKKASLHNKKLRDCRVHLTKKHDRAEESTLFITEGDSASGSITKARDVNTQAVFSLKGLRTADRIAEFAATPPPIAKAFTSYLAKANSTFCIRIATIVDCTLAQMSFI